MITLPKASWVIFAKLPAGSFGTLPPTPLCGLVTLLILCIKVNTKPEMCSEDPCGVVIHIPNE